MNYLQIINKVMIRLREDEEQDLSAGYTKLIGEFVNEAKREVEDAWSWVQLRNTIQVTTVASTLRYTLTGSGKRSQILYVINDTDNYEVQRANSKWMTMQLTTSNTTNGQPSYYDVNGTSGGDYNVDLFPVPDAGYAINFNMKIPQVDLVELDDEITVPEYPVILAAYAKAISERGEDSGIAYRDALVNAEKALSDAIAYDASYVPSELVWEVM
tara:strand:+ start:3102 stop:3743 length:642 start_codon:yes stop_codon:yes gene_type:complete